MAARRIHNETNIMTTGQIKGMAVFALCIIVGTIAAMPWSVECMN